MTVRIMRFTKLLLGLGLAACAWPLSGQNARQEIYADPDKAGGVYYAYTYDNPARTPAPEGYEPFYISHYGRHGSRWLLRASEYTEVLETFGKAAREGASYIAFGRFFTSQTKPGAPSATPALLEQARARFALPITAIGGVGLDNGAELINRGADLLAVVHALFSAPSATEVEARARAFGALFTAS